MLQGDSRFLGVMQILYREATPFIRRKLVSVLGLVVIAAMFGALGPVALKLIVDTLTGHRPQRGVSLLMLLALYVATQWLARAAGEIRQLLYGRVERRIFRTLSERLFAHLMHLPLRFHLNRHTGAISETLANGLEGFQIILHNLIFTVLPLTAELATIVIVLWRLAPVAFLVLFCAALLLYAVAFGYSAVTLSNTARSASAARLEAGAAITDSLLNYETVKYFTAESLVQERVGEALERNEAEWVLFYRRFTRNGLLVSSIFAAFLGATTWYATIEVQTGRMTVGDFVLVNTYMLQLVRPVEMLGYAMQGFSQGLAMLEKILLLFRETPESSPQLHSVTATGPGSLEFSEVTLSYGPDRRVLKNVSFRIPPKSTLGIVGPSGSGKSTLVRLLMRLLEPDSGQILLDNVAIANVALQNLRNAIAIVPQDTFLFNDTIAHNISIGRAQATQAEIECAARVAHLHDFIVTLPNGYSTSVGERGVKLSGGEKQRLSIARAVLKSPRIYVFDEATASLDSRTEQDILESLRDIATHSSTLVIAHRLSTVLHADEILVLDAGQILERGTHSTLLHQNARYAALWRAQHQGAAAA